MFMTNCLKCDDYSVTPTSAVLRDIYPIHSRRDTAQFKRSGPPEFEVEHCYSVYASKEEFFMRFKFLKNIGHGSQAKVWRVKDRQLNQKVALKEFVKDELTFDELEGVY